MFWKELLKAMRFMGFERSFGDPCLYWKWETDGLILWLSWIDDCFCVGNLKAVHKYREEMKGLFDCDDVGNMDEYVGCKIERGHGYLKFTQPVLMQSYEDEFNLPERSYETPAEPNKVLQPTIEDQECDPDEQKIYRSGVGKLLHMMRWSRPELWNSVRELSRRMGKYNKDQEMSDQELRGSAQQGGSASSRCHSGGANSRSPSEAWRCRTCSCQQPKSARSPARKPPCKSKA